MPGLDDRLRRDLERLARPGDSSGALNRVSARKRRAGLMRRVQVAGLVVAVVGASAGGTWALTRVFRDAEVEPAATGPKVRNGKIAFVSDRGGNEEIYVMDPDGSNVVRLTNHPGVDTDPTWSPDGSQIAFVSDRSGNPEIHIMNADGSGARRLTESRGLNPLFPRRNCCYFPSSPDWSPDGSRIAFFAGTRVVTDCPPGCNVTVIYLVSSTETRSPNWTDLSNVEPAISIFPRYERYPTWSWDGTRIAYDSLESPFLAEDPPPHDPSGTFVIAANGGNRQGPLEPVGPFLSQVDWSPLDDRLVFTTGDSIRVGLLRNTGVFRFDELVSLDADNVSIGEPTWSPDATKIAYLVRRGDSEDVYVMNADGSGQTNITNHPADDFAPAWQPLPIGSPTVEPTSPLPTSTETIPMSPSPVKTIEPVLLEEFQSRFGPLCGTAVGGDFEGNGQQDLAAAAFPLSGETCPQDPGDQAWSVFVIWNDVSSGLWSLPECVRACRAFAAADLDGDGADEFFLLSDEGASTQFIRVFGLPLSSVGPTRFDVAPPTEWEDFPGGEPLVLEYGGSVAHQAFITCDQGDGEHHVLASIAELSDDQANWLVTETTFLFDSGAAVESEVNEGVPERHANAFTVTRTLEYIVPFDPTGEEPLPIPGDPCWVLD